MDAFAILRVCVCYCAHEINKRREQLAAMAYRTAAATATSLNTTSREQQSSSGDEAPSCVPTYVLCVGYICMSLCASYTHVKWNEVAVT